MSMKSPHENAPGVWVGTNIVGLIEQIHFGERSVS